MLTLIKNANIIVRDNELKKVNVLIEDGIIKSMDSNEETADKVIDIKGKLLMPGLVDVHIHLREPGFTHKETIETGTMAAAKGGFTTVCSMPNVNPVPDTVETFNAINEIIEKDAIVKVHQYAPITKALVSDELVDMKAINAFAYTNDGVGVQTAGTMYQAMLEAQSLNKAIVAHTEDNSLLYGGVMHKGTQSEKLGLKGIMSATESSQIARDVILAYETKVHYHVCHVSTKESIAAIKMGKAIGANVTSEVSPHHLLLSHLDITSNDGAYKMNPPLRGEDDKEVLIQALIDGDIEIIATDHAPHAKEEKALNFDGPFGIIGLETAFPLLYTEFVEKQKRFTLENLQNWMSIKPKELFNLEGNFMNENDAADFAVFDLDKTVTIDKNFIRSKSENTPFMNQTIKGACVMTLVDGNVVYEELV
ncbi:MAG: dihydroorotase [Erysipelothrix sp.]|nr:dihydroorotase [Erysipelothrix sp.]